MKEWLYDWGGLNVLLFQAINAHHAPWLDRIMLALTWAGDHNRFAIYLAALALVAWRHFAQDPSGASARTWMLALATFSIGYLLDGMLVLAFKDALDFPRPPAVFPAAGVVVIGTAEFHHSLPSGHAAFAALVAASLWPMPRSLAGRIALVLFAVLVSLSRPYLGFHFPADVLFGNLLSVLVVVAVRAALTKWMPVAPR
jgi:membrane-associated phospholipid phosphatase